MSSSTIILMMIAVSGGVTPPEGWVEIAEPREAELMCTTRSVERWAIRNAGRDVAVVAAGQGDSVPAPLRENAQLTRGLLRSAAVVDGFLVASNMGEWGGWLRWYSADAMEHYTVADTLVADLKCQSPSECVVAGSESILDNKGFVEWLSRSPEGKWSATRRIAMTGVPMAVAAWRAGLLVATVTGVFYVDRRTNTPRLVSEATRAVVPNSIFVTNAGDVWVGANHYILSFEIGDDGSAPRVHWYVRRGCEVPRWDGLLCRCSS